jgi:hypothetical protein
MRFRTALSLATLFLLCFTVAAWSTPYPDRLVAGPLQPTPDNQSLSGKISSVGDASFAVEVMKNQNLNTVQFQTDGNTKVEGKLTVGAQATVEYRSEGGRNVAVHVVVTPASGMNLY